MSEMNEKWFVNNDIPLLTSSRIVAKVFSKQHGHVMRKIRSIQKWIHAIEGGNQMFEITEWKDKQNKTQDEYLMTRDGFVFLAMSFTGEDATEWKLKFIKAFNSMEAKLIELNEKKIIAKNQASLDHGQWVQMAIEFPAQDDGRPLRLIEKEIAKKLNGTHNCEMCEKEMTEEEYNFCDICPDCLDNEN